MQGHQISAVGGFYALVLKFHGREKFFRQKESHNKKELMKLRGMTFSGFFEMRQSRDIKQLIATELLLRVRVRSPCA